MQSYAKSFDSWSVTLFLYDLPTKNRIYYCIKTEFSVWSGGDCIVRLYTLHCRAISLSGLRDMGVLRSVSGGSGWLWDWWKILQAVKSELICLISYFQIIYLHCFAYFLSDETLFDM